MAMLASNRRRNDWEETWLKLNQANNGGYVVQDGKAVPISVINQQNNLNLSARQAQNLLSGNTQFGQIIAQTIEQTANNAPQLVTNVEIANF